ncbi:peroxiredoxin [Marmoricola sp. URHA0025 HA25]
MFTKPGQSSDAGRRYRIDRPTLAVLMRDLRVPRHDLGPGDAIPRLDLPTTDGGRVTNESVAADGRPLVLVFGSSTCPVTESAGAGLLRLHHRYGQRFRFVVVNVREAHPGRNVPQPDSLEEKARHAVALKEHHGFGFEVAVDDIDGTVHRAFGTRPSSAYVIDPSGIILFRAQWSNSPDALEKAIRSLAADQLPSPRAVADTARSLVRMVAYADVALDSAGRGARRDFWLAAPPMAALIALSRPFSFLPRRHWPAAACASAVVLTAALVAVVLTAVR